MLHAVHERREKAHEEAERGMFTAGEPSIVPLGAVSVAARVELARRWSTEQSTLTAGGLDRIVACASDLGWQAGAQKRAREAALAQNHAALLLLCSHHPSRRHHRGGGTDQARAGAAPPPQAQVGACERLRDGLNGARVLNCGNVRAALKLQTLHLLARLVCALERAQLPALPSALSHVLQLPHLLQAAHASPPSWQTVRAG